LRFNKNTLNVNINDIFVLYTIHVQEIDLQLQQERERGDNLENQLITLQQQYEELLTRIISVETYN
jgi:hypothetical protein